MFLFHRRILSLPAPTGSLSFQSSRKGTPTYFLFPHLLIVAQSSSRLLREALGLVMSQPHNLTEETKMKLYGAIDLHSTNNVTVVIDEQDRVVYQKRLPNDLALILMELSVYQTELQGIVVESTYNWYWLVDGLMEQGYKVQLANTAAIQQYEGLKYSNDDSDARWLAHVLRLGVLPEGYIYPRADRPVRDLLRKRSQLVRQRTTNLLSIQTLMTRNTASPITANQIKGLDKPQVDGLLPDGDLSLAVKANWSVMCSADEQVELLEQRVTERVKLRAQF